MQKTSKLVKSDNNSPISARIQAKNHEDLYFSKQLRRDPHAGSTCRVVGVSSSQLRKKEANLFYHALRHFTECPAVKSSCRQNDAHGKPHIRASKVQLDPAKKTQIFAARRRRLDIFPRRKKHPKLCCHACERRAPAPKPNPPPVAEKTCNLNCLSQSTTACWHSRIFFLQG